MPALPTGAAIGGTTTIDGGQAPLPKYDPAMGTIRAMTPKEQAMATGKTDGTGQAQSTPSEAPLSAAQSAAGAIASMKQDQTAKAMAAQAPAPSQAAFAGLPRRGRSPSPRPAYHGPRRRH